MIKITKWVDPKNLKGYFELEDFNDIYEDVIIKDLYLSLIIDIFYLYQ